jgi:hypothetical protein
MAKVGIGPDGEPYSTPLGHKQAFGADYVWPRVLGPGEQGGLGLGAPSLEGGQPGDKIQVGGSTYVIVADTGDGYSVETLSGAPAGTISKWHEQAELVQEKAEADVEAGKGGLSSADVLKPYSQKSKSGGGYFFADLDNMEPGDEFTDKTGTVYVVAGKSTDGYYVRFRRKAEGEGGELYQAPAATRVKLPLLSK